jgi:hypothetical protein
VQLSAVCSSAAIWAQQRADLWRLLPVLQARGWSMVSSRAERRVDLWTGSVGPQWALVAQAEADSCGPPDWCSALEQPQHSESVVSDRIQQPPADCSRLSWHTSATAAGTLPQPCDPSQILRPLSGVGIISEISQARNVANHPVPSSKEKAELNIERNVA